MIVITFNCFCIITKPSGVCKKLFYFFPHKNLSASSASLREIFLPHCRNIRQVQRIEDGKKAFYYHFHMLGYLGCFLDYRYKSENGIVKEPVLGLLSWFGHDFLRQLAVELGEEEVH